MDEMKASRLRLGLTMAQMAGRLGLSLRAYAAIEGGETPVRKSHLMAMRLLTLEEAVDRGDPALADGTVALLAGRFTRIRPRQPATVEA